MNSRQLALQTWREQKESFMKSANTVIAQISKPVLLMPSPAYQQKMIDLKDYLSQNRPYEEEGSFNQVYVNKITFVINTSLIELASKLAGEFGGQVKFWMYKIREVASNVQYYPSFSMWEINRAYEQQIGLSPQIAKNIRKKHNLAKNYLAAVSNLLKHIDRCGPYEDDMQKLDDAFLKQKRAEEKYIDFLKDLEKGGIFLQNKDRSKIKPTSTLMSFIKKNQNKLNTLKNYNFTINKPELKSSLTKLQGEQYLQFDSIFQQMRHQRNSRMFPTYERYKKNMDAKKEKNGKNQSRLSNQSDNPSECDRKKYSFQIKQRAQQQNEVDQQQTVIQRENIIQKESGKKRQSSGKKKQQKTKEDVVVNDLQLVGSQVFMKTRSLTKKENEKQKFIQILNVDNQCIDKVENAEREQNEKKRQSIEAHQAVAREQREHGIGQMRQQFKKNLKKQSSEIVLDFQSQNVFIWSKQYFFSFWGYEVKYPRGVNLKQPLQTLQFVNYQIDSEQQFDEYNAEDVDKISDQSSFCSETNHSFLVSDGCESDHSSNQEIQFKPCLAISRWEKRQNDLEMYQAVPIFKEQLPYIVNAQQFDHQLIEMMNGKGRHQIISIIDSHRQGLSRDCIDLFLRENFTKVKTKDKKMVYVHKNSKVKSADNRIIQNFEEETEENSLSFTGHQMRSRIIKNSSVQRKSVQQLQQIGPKESSEPSETLPKDQKTSL